MTAPLYTMAEVLAATGGEGRGTLPDAIEAVSIDSREVGPGTLFVAIKGERFDGHDFVAQALANGAAAALVSADKASGLNGPLVVVRDALQGLSDLAAAARARSGARIVAVTGSAGKTTTKEAIRTVLSAAGPTHASIKSFNNHWGVPLMLARLKREARFAVFEIGMNHAGEITPLSRLVRPHIAVVTTVAAAHLEFFDSVAGIARAKAEIFAGLEPGGVAVLNADHEHLPILVEAAEAAGAGRIITYGFDPGAEVVLTAVSASEASVGGDRLTILAKGRHMLANAAAALIVAELAGIERAAALQALASFGAPQGRGEAALMGRGERQLLLIDESYNANPASMRAALEVFAGETAPGGRRVLVLGDMLELGEGGDALHAGLADAVRAAKADAVFLVGPRMAALVEALGAKSVAGYAQSVDGLMETLPSQLAYGDAVMVKGSNGVRLTGLVTKIRQLFG
jgi:UDP-N-acetylmuramoyl-tripeptide--D-alanyl-D-alanine ligase